MHSNNRLSRIRSGALCHSCGLGLLMAILLTACGSLVDTGRPADDRFWLEPLRAQGIGNDGGVVILQLDVVPGLDTERVLVLGPGARLGQVDQARWADNLPEVLASVLRRSLENNGISASDRRSSHSAVPCELKVEVREFFAVAEAAGINGVRVSLGGVLECAGTRYPLDLSVAPRSSSGAREVVAALQQALDEVSRSLMRQLEVVPGYQRPLS